MRTWEKCAALAVAAALPQGVALGGLLQVQDPTFSNPMVPLVYYASPFLDGTGWTSSGPSYLSQGGVFEGTIVWQNPPANDPTHPGHVDNLPVDPTISQAQDPDPSNWPYEGCASIVAATGNQLTQTLAADFTANKSYQLTVAVGTNDPSDGYPVPDANASIQLALFYTDTGGAQHIVTSTSIYDNPVTGLGGTHLLDFSTPFQSVNSGDTAIGLPIGILMATSDPDYVGGFFNVDNVRVTTVDAKDLIWGNSGTGPGDGSTWNASQHNWFNGSPAAVAYSDTSYVTSGDNVSFNNITGGTSGYNVTVSGIVHPASITFNNNAGTNYNISGSGSIAGASGLTLNAGGTVTLSTSNNYSGGTFVNAGTLILASANAFPANTSLNVSAGAQVTIANHPGNSTYVPLLSALSNNGTIDITNNAMVIQGSSITTIYDEIAAACNGGAWNGSSGNIGVVTSSTAAGDSIHLTAVGVATGLTSFADGSASSAEVLVKYTYYGDANLSGVVDGSDYSLIDNGYLKGLSDWQNGDFNYDGKVNGSDYTLIDNTFNSQGTAIATEIGVPTAQIAERASAVPEPTTLGLLSMASIGVLGRRNRRRWS